MPSRRLKLRYTPRAQADITEIIEYSFLRWGEHQADMYQAAIRRTVSILADEPEIGRVRHELSPGLKSHPVGSHVIYYLAFHDELLIIRILHDRRDPAREMR